MFDRDTSLWVGFILKSPKHNVYYVGDTGYSNIFKEIGRKEGPFDLSCIPIGAYSPQMVYNPDCTGDTTASITVTSYGIYSVTLTDINNCVSTDEIELVEIPFTPFLTGDTTILEGDAIQLEAGGGLNYEWWPATDLSCVLCTDPVATPSDSITYYVAISATNYCVDTLAVHIDLFNINNPVIDPPTVITPPNDVWDIPGIQFYPYNRVIIVNRWGDVVFEDNPYNNDWTGTHYGAPLPQGTYYYYFALDVNQLDIKIGPITILR